MPRACSGFDASIMSLSWSVSAVLFKSAAPEDQCCIDAGGVSKARSPTLHERLAHSQRAARSNASGGSTTTSSPATSGTSGGTVTGSGSQGGGTGATSQIGCWTEVDKAALLAIVHQVSQQFTAHKCCQCCRHASSRSNNLMSAAPALSNTCTFLAWSRLFPCL